ncbi:ATP-binding protein [Lachnobacterium bovis]|uniref:ATP-binding protein n=1 Tax=Lachnobacterium bovis TaxID=140626 RepID=UPI0003B450FB|nr:ATP-binding protein [Lachnobacterium bovis]
MNELLLTIEDFKRNLFEYKEKYILLDLRDGEQYMYGHIPNAINCRADILNMALDNIQNGDIDKVLSNVKLEKNKKIIIYSDSNKDSLILGKKLYELGYDVKVIKDGYVSWILYKMEQEVKDDESDKNAEVELSIRKKFHKKIFSKFAKAIKTYELLKPNDKVMVCISGGKDSMLMAKLFQELKRHDRFPFELEFVVMDPGYNNANRNVIEKNAKLLDIPIKIFETPIFDTVVDIEKSPCYLCARMRRGYLYSYAQKLGCNKIALGHHYDDVIETILMGMLYGAQIQTMMPKLHSTNFEGLELIRPLYLVREEDIIKWREYNELYFLQCACKFTDETSSLMGNSLKESSSKRKEVKNLIKELKKVNPYVEGNIFKSVENVNLSTIIAYKTNGHKYSFLDSYDEK